MIEDRELKDTIKESYIISYKEDVSLLYNSLQFEGLNPFELRAHYTREELQAPSATRTFINHHKAWQKAAMNDGYTLICEADFVPCRGIGDMPTFWPLDDPMAWGYLYQGSPRVFARVGTHLRGHCAPLVAYVINKNVAKLLIEFYNYEIGRHDLKEYYTFDAHLQWFMMGKGAKAFISYKHYGEHGGLPNPEHAQSKLSRKGRHRADSLAAPLHFLPHYARGSRLRFMGERLRYKLYGFLRIFSNRWIVETNVHHNSMLEKFKLNLIGIRRLI